MCDVTIRVMTIDDYDQIYDLWIHTPGMGLNNLDDSRDGIARYLKRNPTTCFAALQGGKIVGVILSGHDGRRGYIHHTAVAVQARRKGIAAGLVSHAMEALKREGIHKVALVAFERNLEGNAFWESQGFSVREDLVYRNKNISELIRMDT
ncbi:GNAT family N-acetyltransferase [Lachnotalea sp. AF33-28]|uniref:GNAT family N-acetyltransferase n=1 Tax=Lachnotalea sp. AF33-28 TaxID=2292046 RepID=UPI0018F2E082|nr:GNAT family N-acetyltransferase [Lachnotalea sp. AF33-28]